MPFGPKGAVTHFQRVIEQALSGHESYTATYVDNVLIFSKSVEEHIKQLKKVIEALTAVGFKLNTEKCKLGYSRIRIMGIGIDEKSKRVDWVKVEMFQELGRPKCGKDVEALLGFVNYLRDFIPLYAYIVGPLEKLRKVKRIIKEVWSTEQEEAFALLKGVNMPDWDKEFIIATDASQYGIGAVLYQRDEKGESKYIEFAATALNMAQSNYSALKRELLAMYFALKRW